MIERTAKEKIQTTEWEDVQYRFGNRVGQYIHKESQILDQKNNEFRSDALLTYDPVMEKISENLEVSDSSDDELQNIREKMRRNLQSSRFTRKNITCTDYEHYREAVTERSKYRTVLLVIHENQDPSCQNILDILDSLSTRELKMISIVSISVQEARISLPFDHLPCVVVYSKGEVVDTTYGTSEWGDESMDAKSVLDVIKKKGYREYY